MSLLRIRAMLDRLSRIRPVNPGDNPLIFQYCAELTIAEFSGDIRSINKEPDEPSEGFLTRALESQAKILANNNLEMKQHGWYKILWCVGTSIQYQRISIR